MTLTDGTYSIQGLKVLDVCEKYGTPLYVYDAQVMARQFQTLQQAFSAVKQLRINYAVKALTNISVIKWLHSLGSCADTVSIQEVELCLKAGYAPADIGFTPSGVCWEEIEAAVALGVKIHIDSLPLLARFGQKYGANYPIGIRLNPHVLAGGNFKISTAHERSKFGISILQIPDILKIMSETGIVIEGLHQHIPKGYIYFLSSSIIFF